MKPREPRKKVLIDARLRHDRGWSDALILNISRRGLMARAPTVPPRGTYIEICRGSQRIVARVVWAKDGQFGAQAQDAIAIEAPTRSEEETTSRRANPGNDRRLGPRAPTSAERLERSRRRSRRAEFAAVAFLSGIAAVLAFEAVGESLSRPLNLIEAKLGAKG